MSITNGAKATFEINVAAEFLASLYIIGNLDELLVKANQLSLEITEEVNHLIEDITNNVSPFIKREAEFFFKSPYEGGFYEMLANNPKIKDVDELISFIEKVDDLIFIKYMVEAALEKAENIDAAGDWDSVPGDRNKLLSFIDESKISDPNIRERLLEMNDNPVETKDRCIFMLRQYYNKTFKKNEIMYLSLQKKSIDKYEDIYKSNTDDFFNKYLRLDPNTCEKAIRIIMSIFAYAGWARCVPWDTGLSETFILGVNTDLLYKKEETEEVIGKFLKIISDPKRIEIIRFLSNNTSYISEIARVLKITPSTVNYHMGFLLQIDMANMSKEGKNMYYTLNKTKTEILLKDLKDYLLG